MKNFTVIAFTLLGMVFVVIITLCCIHHLLLLVWNPNVNIFDFFTQEPPFLVGLVCFLVTMGTVLYFYFFNIMLPIFAKLKITAIEGKADKKTLLDLLNWVKIAKTKSLKRLKLLEDYERILLEKST